MRKNKSKKQAQSKQLKLENFFHNGSHCRKPLPSSEFRSIKRKISVTNDEAKKQKISHETEIGRANSAECSLKLPTNALIKIFRFLPQKDIYAVSQVCKQWKLIADNTAFWKPVFLRKCKYFPFVINGQIRPMVTWKHLYNSFPLPFASPLPFYGAHFWVISFSLMENSFQKLNRFMGVAKPFVLIGIKSECTGNQMLTQKKETFQKVEAIDRTILLLIDNVYRKFMILTSDDRTNFSIGTWKLFPPTVTGATYLPFFRVGNTTMKVSLTDIYGITQETLHEED